MRKDVPTTDLHVPFACEKLCASFLRNTTLHSFFIHTSSAVQYCNGVPRSVRWGIVGPGAEVAKGVLHGKGVDGVENGEGMSPPHRL